jgi:hypothetical protein
MALSDRPLGRYFGRFGVRADMPKRSKTSLLTRSRHRPAALSGPEAGYLGESAMEWFKGKTSIAGYQVSNWIIALGAIIVVLLVLRH